MPVRGAAGKRGEVVGRGRKAGVERSALDRGGEIHEITRLVQGLASTDATQLAALTDLPHIRVGRLQVERRVDAPSGDIATFQRLYEDAVSVAGKLWDGAQSEGKPDPNASRGIVDSLAQAAPQNPPPLP